MLIPRRKVFHIEGKQVWGLLDGGMPGVTGSSEKASVVETLWEKKRVVCDEVTVLTVGQIMCWLV